MCHPVCGQIVFVLTFLARPDLARFRAGPEADALAALRGLVEGGGPDFARSGTLLPDTHTLASLLKFLRANVRGTSHADHNVRRVARECAKWFPRREEYEPFVHWNEHNPSAYTRNLVFGNAHMDVLLMCWPPHSVSSIHGHDDSSCWVVLVAGEVWEVQYAVPKVCNKFMQEQMRNPTGAVGRCGPLKVTGESKLAAGNGGVTTAYANNDLALHRVENRTDAPAYTLHVYAPGLRKIKLFRECGEVSVCTVSAAPVTSAFGKLTGEVGKHTHPDGVLDVEAWNANQCGRGGTGGSRS